MKKIGVQEYLSLGYIYLLIVGLLTNVIYYSFLGINILNYSTFVDVLIAPIKLLTGNIILPIMLLFIGGLMYASNKFITSKIKNASGVQKKERLPIENLVPRFAFLVLVLFVGLGVGMGVKMKSQIEEGRIEVDHTLTFVDYKQIKVKIVGQNSMFLFYVSEHERELTITPIGDNIYQIKKIAVR
jgi:heme/copper-type cytochrome/quinol oxidase subunit 2